MERGNIGFNPQPRNEDVKKESRGLEVRDYESQIQKLNEEITNYKKIIEELKSKVEQNELTDVKAIRVGCEDLLIKNDKFRLSMEETFFRKDRMFNFCELFNVSVTKEERPIRREEELDSVEYYDFADDYEPMFRLDTSKLSKALYGELKKILEGVKIEEYNKENEVLDQLYRGPNFI